ncbi:hypothetical protein [Caenimonas sp. SL110]|uniref:hypothetical protein n=1 Tax=Caenimonas sp. SL110 TaxID=1450524 RepID=UPI00128C6D04|nr:hypothetical protein [Caenimonas sp. SL110]
MTDVTDVTYLGADRDKDEVLRLLERAGIDVGEQHLAFLQRTRVRQREVLRLMAAQVPAQTEPAHVFRAATR